MHKYTLRMLLICCLTIIFSIFPFGVAFADDDDGTNEVGVFWVTDYVWPLPDLPNSDDGAQGFLGVMDDYYTSRFDHGTDQFENDNFEHNGDADTVDIGFIRGMEILAP
jgi:hypothetical protein